MSLLSELYVSSVTDAPKYDSSPEPFAPHRAEYQGLTYEEFANLWAVMCDRDPAESDADAFDTLLNVDGGQRLINRFPDDFVARLAVMNEREIEFVAEKWVQHGELSFMECSPGDVIPILESLRNLAFVAVTEQKLLCLWMCV
jgi:hypothetical protein